jgi:hypothetical protein
MDLPQTYRAILDRQKKGTFNLAISPRDVRTPLVVGGGGYISKENLCCRKGQSLWNKIRKPLGKAINQAISSHLPPFFPGLEVGWEPSRVPWATCTARNMPSVATVSQLLFRSQPGF